MSIPAITLAALGVLAWSRILSGHPRPRSLVHLAVEALAVHAVCSTLVAAALVTLGVFRVEAAQGLAVLPPLALIALGLPRRPAPIRGTPAVTLPALLTLLVLILVAPVSLPRQEVLHMTGDAGVYSNRAIDHLQTGDLEGRIPVRDRLSGELRAAFDRDNLLGTAAAGAPETCSREAYLPGTYVVRPGDVRFQFQFFPGWPMLMALWAGLFGTHALFHSVFFAFALAAMLFAFLLEQRGVGVPAFAVVVATFASSPLLVFISKYTTSEAFLLFLFLFVLHFLARGTSLGAGLAVMGVLAIAVTHVSTLLYGPLLLLPLAEAWRSRDPRLASFCLGAFACLLLSLPLGLVFSPCYVQDIYGMSFRFLLSEPARTGLLAVAIFDLGGLVLSLIALFRARRGSASVPAPPGEAARRWVTLALRAALVVLAAWTAYRGYLLGWTDRYVPELPARGAWGHRIHYAGQRWTALAHLNVVSVVMGTSLVGLPLVLVMAWRRAGEVVAARHRAFLLGAVLYSLAIYTVLRVDTPLNYYASRYFVPVLVPSVLLLLAELLRAFRVRRVWIAALALVALGFNVRFDAVLARPSADDEMRFVRDVGERVGRGRVLFVRNHRRDHREAQQLLALPLQSLYGIALVNVTATRDVDVDERIADYGRVLGLQDAAVLARRLPEAPPPSSTVTFVGRRLVPHILYSRRVAERTQSYHLYEVSFR